MASAALNVYHSDSNQEIITSDLEKSDEDDVALLASIECMED